MTEICRHCTTFSMQFVSSVPLFCRSLRRGTGGWGRRPWTGVWLWKCFRRFISVYAFKGFFFDISSRLQRWRLVSWKASSILSLATCIFFSIRKSRSTQQTFNLSASVDLPPPILSSLPLRLSPSSLLLLLFPTSSSPFILPSLPTSLLLARDEGICDDEEHNG